MIAHHEAAQTAASGWVALGGAGGLIVAVRLTWARLRGRQDQP